MGSITTILNGLLAAIANGDIDLTAIISGLMNSSAQQETPQ
ncbi:hypothetical protein [Rhodococcus sp. ABRD24]|nr:hypothetical protein [Rhodococcus sp. ABRD24]